MFQPSPIGFLVPAVKAGPSCPAWLRAEEIVRTADAAALERELVS